MVKQAIQPTRTEQMFGENEIIVSKTDLKGRITYCNRTFMKVSGFTTKELYGQPHSIIRHPDMPRAIFKVLWDGLEGGREIFAYVKNICKNGDYYWVLAHATQTYDENGNVLGYHSTRRVPTDRAKRSCEALYRELRQIEEAQSNAKDGLNRSMVRLHEILEEKGMSYDEFVFSL